VTKIVVAGVEVLDGTGTPGRVGDVWIEDDTVVRVSPPHERHDGWMVVPADGLVLTPGFVDVHSHADRSPFRDEPDVTKILQGITTEVVGNCGASPLGAGMADGDDGEPTAYLKALDEARLVTNLAPLVGHGALRRRVMGWQARPAAAADVAGMRGLWEAALDAGAFGLSSGLFYAPGSYADESELVRLIAGFQGRPIVYASHIRNEGRRVVAAVDELLAVGRATGVRLQLSHHKAAGLPNWGKTAETLAHIADARRAGVQVALDIYPYTASSTSVSATLPGWVMEGGTDAALDRLADPQLLSRIQWECEHPAADWESMIEATGYDRMVIAANPGGDGEGLTLAQFAASRGLSPFDGTIALLRESRLTATMVAHSMDESDLLRVAADSLCWIGTDGVTGPRSSRPHPRLTGTFPRAWRQLVVERGLWSPEEAVHRMTDGPARYFHLPHRGRIQPGYTADLVLMDPKTMADGSSFADPWQPPIGIKSVWLSGKQVVTDNHYLGNREASRLVPAAD